MMKTHSSGRMVSSGINDVVITSGHYEKTHLKKLMVMIIIIRECSSTPYVELAKTAPQTNTKFRITFLLIRHLEALYEDLLV